MPNIKVFVTEKQKDFLELIIHTDAADSMGGCQEASEHNGKLGSNAVQWCIDACMKIEERYKEHGIDACYIGFHGTPIEEELANKATLATPSPTIKSAEEVLIEVIKGIYPDWDYGNKREDALYQLWHFCGQKQGEKIIYEAMEQYASQFRDKPNK